LTTDRSAVAAGEESFETIMDVTALAMQISVVAFMIAKPRRRWRVAPRDVLAPLTHGRFVLLTLAIGWVAGRPSRSCCWAIPLTAPTRPRSCCWPWRRARRLPWR
jgi:hypothetical protein